MKYYYVRRGYEPPFIGPLTTEGIDAAVARGELRGHLMAIEAAGRTAEQLATAAEWQTWTSSSPSPPPPPAVMPPDEWARQTARAVTLERLRSRSSYPLVRSWLQIGAGVASLLALSPVFIAVTQSRDSGDVLLFAVLSSGAAIISIGVAYGLARAALDVADAALDRATRDTLADLERARAVSGAQ